MDANSKQKKNLRILIYPNEKLRKKCALVDLEKDLPNIQKLIDLMFQTMKFFGGIGLSAPQIGVGFQVCVVDLQDGSTLPHAFINPKIVQFEGKVESEEGCLSFPGMRGHVERFSKIEVEYYNYNGSKQTLVAEGLLAICLQHEIDHLSGILFIDKVSNLKRNLILKRLKKIGRL